MSLKDHFLLIKPYGAHSFIIIISRTSLTGYISTPLTLFYCWVYLFILSFSYIQRKYHMIKNLFWITLSPHPSWSESWLTDRGCRFRSRPNTRTWLLDLLVKRTCGNVSIRPESREREREKGEEFDEILSKNFYLSLSGLRTARLHGTMRIGWVLIYGWEAE